MNYLDILSKRRSYYHLSDPCDLDKTAIQEMVTEVVLKTPSSFHMQEGTVVLLFGEKSRAFWEKVNETYQHSIDPEKQKGFQGAAGTILFFIDQEIVEKTGKNFPAYAEKLKIWAHHGNAMLQLNTWNGLRAMGLGASLQHYHPKIDSWVHEDYEIPESWELVAQMPFGSIEKEPDPKEKRPIEERLKIIE